MRRLWRWTPFALCVLATACSQGGNSVLPARDSPPYEATRVRTSVTLRVSIPRKRSHRARFVSPATQSIAITVTPSGGGTARKFDFNLTPATDPNCTASPIVCTLNLPLRTGTYVASVSTYDGLLSGGNPTGNELSANQSVPLTVKTGTANALKVTLGGIPASVAFIAQTNASFSGDVTNGFTLSKCATPQKASVYGVDADGNFIFGAGSPSVSLASDDAADLAIATPAPSSPNKFVLSRPRIPNYYTAVHLTAKATPAAASGAASASALVKVTFNGDVCGTFTEFTIPTANSQPFGITRGNGNHTIWFTESNGNKIGRISIDTLAMNEYTVPTAGAQPRGITSFFGDGMWFTEYNASRIGKVATDGTVTDYPTTTAASHPQGITFGFDGALWFTESSANNIGRMSSTGAMTNEYPLLTGSATPYDITQGPDGAFWFTECTANTFGRITINGILTEPWSIASNSGPKGIAAQFFGNSGIWFAEENSGKLGLLFPDFGVQNEISVPGSPAPVEIVFGPDGNVWATDFANNTLDSYPSSGGSATMKQTTIPTAFALPLGIVVGDDGALWFTEIGANKIGRLQ